ncbi:MAG TPA: hypothetical protein VFM63_04235 [Pyrinomonadaceae bacterium]|nr:hypothetical protein [Pyrinomonadaceae bacterium]
MTPIKRLATGPLTILICGASLIALCLLQPATVKAQWTTPDANQNINNTNTGNVGIGTTTPATKVEISSASPLIQMSDTNSVGAKMTIGTAGQWSGLSANRNLATTSHFDTGKTTAGYFMFVANSNSFHWWGTTPTNNTEPLERMRLDKDGNLGIGTGSPTAASGYTALSLSNSTGTLIDFMTSNSLKARLQSDGTTFYFNNLANGPIQIYTNNAERMRVDASGNVGIGTTSPGRKLEILAADGEAVRLYRNASNAGWGVNMKFAFNNSSGTQVDYAGLHGLIANATAGAETGDFVLTTATSGTLTEKLRVTSAGSVGIGTANPSYKLHVVGGSINTTDGLCLNGDCKSAWSQIASQWANGTGSINYTSGSVGIGTTSPAYSLDVNGGVNSFRAKAASSSASDNIATFENNSAIQMIVRANGNVGIGTTSPANKLHVAGSITVDGNINAKYQDVAEWVESSQDLTPGTVVILDSSRSNQVVAATQSYDSRVAGVISLKPGIVLGEQGEGRVLVATTGRVKVKVDASNAAIQIGDLLVTSDKEGFAMKSLPVEIGGVRIHRPGTLIGKALEPLARGTGEILVLLSLQ